MQLLCLRSSHLAQVPEIGLDCQLIVRSHCDDAKRVCNQLDPLNLRAIDSVQSRRQRRSTPYPTHSTMYLRGVAPL